jgi:hypothetical protein
VYRSNGTERTIQLSERGPTETLLADLRRATEIDGLMTNHGANRDTIRSIVRGWISYSSKLGRRTHLDYAATQSARPSNIARALLRMRSNVA